jgi:hypothetical protein
MLLRSLRYVLSELQHDTQEVEAVPRSKDLKYNIQSDVQRRCKLYLSSSLLSLVKEEDAARIFQVLVSSDGRKL